MVLHTCLCLSPYRRATGSYVSAITYVCCLWVLCWGVCVSVGYMYAEITQACNKNPALCLQGLCIFSHYFLA